MVVKARRIQDRIAQTKRFDKSRQYLLDLGKSLALYSIWPVTHGPGHFFLIGLAFIYTIITTSLFIVLIYYLDGFTIWIPALTLLGYMCYFYLAGYVYKSVFKSEQYKYYVYVCGMSVVYTPLLIFLRCILYEFADGIFAWLLFIIHLAVSQHLVNVNIKNVLYDDRSALVRYIIILAVQVLGIALLNAPYHKTRIKF